MNKTVYVPDDEAGTWEKARELANDRLSPVIVKALKEFIILGGIGVVVILLLRWH